MTSKIRQLNTGIFHQFKFFLKFQLLLSLRHVRDLLDREEEGEDAVKRATEAVRETEVAKREKEAVGRELQVQFIHTSSNYYIDVKNKVQLFTASHRGLQLI